MQTDRHRSTLAALAIAACVAPVLLIAGLLAFATEIDRGARQREQDVVAHGLANRIEDIQRTVVPQAVWNDAVVNITAGNMDWMRQNVGVYFMGSSDYELAGVIGPNNAMVYAMQGGNEDNHLTPGLDAALQPLVARLREREPNLPPLKHRVATGAVLANPEQVVTIAHVDERYVILSATLVQPDTDASLGVDVSPIMVVSEEVDASFLRAFAERMMLTDLRLIEPGARRVRLQAGIPLTDSSGAEIAQLVWRPQLPGLRLLGAAWPFLAAVMALLGASAFLFHRQAHRALDNLITSEQRARHIALHDQLTGLPNRAQFSEQLGVSLALVRREGTPFAVHCIDLDRFKEVNDTYGHPVGDELIRHVAASLLKVCRVGDIVARLGGDEFAVIQRNATPRGAAELAERIIARMRDPIDLSAGRVFSGCSIGIGVVTRETVTDALDCLRMADLALYRAKDQGRGGYAFFEQEMDAAVRARRRLQADLRVALKNQDLQLHYQPQFNAHDNLIGLEALARWNHPTLGPISPSVFIPVAEECGLIEDIGWFAMRRAFEDGARWPGLKIAVNVSPAQLRLKDFLDRVEQLAAETGVDPTRFEFEITENVLLADAMETHTTLRRLREVGFQIALDDFGTGYSSLSYLQRFPISRIKIDRSFVANLGVDPAAENVVAAIVRLARALNLSIIAEGVETESQRAQLGAAGCGDIQGFLVGRPAPVEQVQRIVETHRLRTVQAEGDHPGVRLAH